MSIGERVKEARKKTGKTQKELAEIMGVRQKDISRWENDVMIPTATTIISLCKALNVSADYILALTEYKKLM